MKYCTKCGTQLMDESVICTKCGCMVEDAIKPVMKIAPKKSVTSLDTPLDKQPSILLIVSNFSHSVVTAFALFFLFLSVAWSDIRSGASVYTTKKSFYLTDVDVSVHAYTCPDYALAAVAIVFSSILVAVSVLSFVMTLIEKHRGERLFSAISKFFIGIVLLVTSIMIECC